MGTKINLIELKNVDAAKNQIVLEEAQRIDEDLTYVTIDIFKGINEN
jgi:hypothetical protein